MESKRLFGKICYIKRQMSRENGLLLSEYGVTPVQMHALSVIYKSTAEGVKVCQKDIEKHLNLRASSVSTLITNLEKGGFIVRTVADGDARTRNLEIAERGKVVCNKSKSLMDGCDGAIEAVLTEEEQAELEKLLTKIIDSIEEHKWLKPC